MSEYPVKIELLSRFRTKAEQGEVVRGLAAGSVDIVIGTHRLISSDISFKTLGLVVIDEEQRFGVKHKERFKVLFRLVDVLTLSATPIPRTLYLALMGARDMSIIETPPKDRLPIHTEIVAFSEERIAEAILREVDRGGGCRCNSCGAPFSACPGDNCRLKKDSAFWWWNCSSSSSSSSGSSSSSSGSSRSSSRSSHWRRFIVIRSGACKVDGGSGGGDGSDWVLLLRRGRRSRRRTRRS